MGVSAIRALPSVGQPPAGPRWVPSESGVGRAIESRGPGIPIQPMGGARQT
jgi:hypothetical protein